MQLYSFGRVLEVRMRSLLSLALFVTFASTCIAQDVQLRARAMELLEHAREVSIPNAASPIANDTVVSFRAVGPDGTTMREGNYTRVFSANGIREEFTLGDFHLVT